MPLYKENDTRRKAANKAMKLCQILKQQKVSIWPIPGRLILPKSFQNNQMG